MPWASAKDLVALGNPHFSVEEHGRMAELCQGRLKHPDVTVVVTSGPQVLDLAVFGARVPHGPYGMLPAPGVGREPKFGLRGAA